MDWGSPDFCDRFRRGDATTLQSIYWAFVRAVEHVLAAGFVTKRGQAHVPGVTDRNRRSDLVQEVFLRAFSDKARKSFDPGLEYRPYLLTISRHVLVDHHRQETRDKVISTPDPEFAYTLPLADSEDPDWLSPALVQVVERYVAGLTSPLREVHQARFVLGRSQRVAALVLGVSRQHLRTLEDRLKDGLRRELLAARLVERSARRALNGTASASPKAAGGRE